MVNCHVELLLLLHTETKNGSSAGAGVILGIVLGVLVFGVMAAIITIAAVLYLIKKGT